MQSTLKSHRVESAERPVEAKSREAFKTISEVSDMLGVPQHVLRFWESRFSQIRPLKLKGGRRYYRPEDIDILKRVKALLYGQGYTIKGAKKVFDHKEELPNFAAEQPVKTKPIADQTRLAEASEKLIAGIEKASQGSLKNHKDELKAVLKELQGMRDLLRRIVQE